MLLPVRCFTCNKVMYQGYWTSFNQMVEEGMLKEKALDKLGLKRDCCRSIISEHVELIDKLIMIKELEAQEKLVHEPAKTSHLHRSDTTASYSDFQGGLPSNQVFDDGQIRKGLSDGIELGSRGCKRPRHDSLQSNE